MFSKSNTRQQDPSRKNFLRLSGATLLAATSLSLLAGCGGGGSNGNSTGGNTGGGGATATLPAGSYQGVYVATSGPSSPDAGPAAFAVSATGVVTGSAIDYTGDGSTTSFSGNVSNTGALVTDVVTGNFSENSTTHVFNTSYTQKDGSHGTLTVGLAPTASPLAGSYSGTATNTAQTQALPLKLTISPTGAVTGTLGTPVAGDPNSGFTLSGYVDTYGSLYLADRSGGVPENFFAFLTLSGTSLTGPTHISAADGYSNTGNLSLTKQ